MSQEPSKTEILQVVSSYIESLNNEDAREEKGDVGAASEVIAAVHLKASREQLRKRVGASLALYGTIWSTWGIVLTVFLYVAALPAAIYLVAWAILTYGVYQLLRGIPLRRHVTAKPLVSQTIRSGAKGRTSMFVCTSSHASASYLILALRF
jgi:hypothetical protein